MHGKNSMASLPDIIERSVYLSLFKVCDKTLQRVMREELQRLKQFVTVKCITGGWTNSKDHHALQQFPVSTGDAQTKVPFKRHCSPTSNKFSTLLLVLLAGQEFTTHNCCSSLKLHCRVCAVTQVQLLISRSITH